MAKVICIAGESGSGKTTSLRNLNPSETYIIDSDKKGLSWKGWKKQYSLENKNYFANDVPETVKKTMLAIHDRRPEIKVLVIDTIGSIMIADEMRRSKEKGYDKWMDLAQCIWDIVDIAYTLRDDLTVVFIAHTQTERDDSGYLFTRIKTSGKKLDKICIETKFTTVLISKCVEGQYIFETHAKNSTAKSPMGLFESDTIPNDIVEVINALEAYESEDI
nr:MAG TPA: AAA domain protein [Caudoviricetes sp.]